MLLHIFDGFVVIVFVRLDLPTCQQSGQGHVCVRV